MKKLLKKIILAHLAVMFSASTAFAADYPEKAVTLIVPYGPGGGTDIIGRVISQILPTYLDVPVVVVNRPGATGTVGTEDVKQAKADGYTMLLNDSGAMTVKPITSKLPYSRDDFKIVASINETPFILTVATDRPYHTLQELIDYSGKHDGQITFSTAGIGSPFHLAMEEIADLAGIPVKHIPAPGTGDAVTMTVGGHVDAVVSYPNAVLSQISSGKLTALAVSSEERLEQLPDVPTFKELGVDYVGRGWKAIFVRSDVEDARRDRLEQAVFKMGEDEKFKSLMDDLGEGVVIKSGDAFTQIWNDEYKRFQVLLKKIGMVK